LGEEIKPEDIDEFKTEEEKEKEALAKKEKSGKQKEIRVLR